MSCTKITSNTEERLSRNRRIAIKHAKNPYLVIFADNNWNIHIMSVRAYVFMFLGSEDVNSNQVHLANQKAHRQHFSRATTANNKQV